MSKQYYRIAPVLWDSIPGQHTATVYCIDRMPEGPLAAFVKCCPRCKDDPAWWWAGPTFLRLVLPPGLGGCCMGPQDISDSVVWALLPTWLSWVLGQGYTVNDGFSFSKTGPMDEITLIYN
jgi:hypothetical protein